MNKTIWCATLILATNYAYATDLTVSDVSVTKVQVYETSDGSTKVWIHLNGNSRVGPNPVNPSTTCELWTNNDAVYSTALSAMMSGKKVSVSYVDRGEGSYWCTVRHFSIKSN